MPFLGWLAYFFSGPSATDEAIVQSSTANPDEDPLPRIATRTSLSAQSLVELFRRNRKQALERLSNRSQLCFDEYGKSPIAEALGLRNSSSNTSIPLENKEANISNATVLDLQNNNILGKSSGLLSSVKSTCTSISSTAIPSFLRDYDSSNNSKADLLPTAAVSSMATAIPGTSRDEAIPGPSRDEAIPGPSRDEAIPGPSRAIPTGEDVIILPPRPIPRRFVTCCRTGRKISTTYLYDTPSKQKPEVLTAVPDSAIKYPRKLTTDWRFKVMHCKENKVEDSEEPKWMSINYNYSKEDGQEYFAMKNGRISDILPKYIHRLMNDEVESTREFFVNILYILNNLNFEFWGDGFTFDFARRPKDRVRVLKVQMEPLRITFEVGDLVNFYVHRGLDFIRVEGTNRRTLQQLQFAAVGEKIPEVVVEEHYDGTMTLGFPSYLGVKYSADD